ncbi:MAG TPA: glycosyltransferase family 2 protein [Candidatus Krumholzibacteria bacterium]|nr:glycosyltransferase family 2 protein [Candidatus Krumholzibacteria bacterium]
MTDFTFAIVNWNTRDLLARCLRSIERESAGFTVQVLVADNGSSDGSADMVARDFPGVTLVRHARNLGFAGGHEALFGKSDGRYHVLVNSDIELLPGCLTALDRRMREDEGIGVLGPQLLEPGGAIQPGCRRFPTLTSQWFESLGLGRLFPHSPRFNGYRMGDFDHRSARDVDQVMGSFFLIRRELLAEIGILDTRFFMYYEEVDYCLRVRRAGYRVFFEPDARVRHLGGGTSSMVRVATIRRKMRSMHDYFQKHRGPGVYLPLVAICATDGASHCAAALLTGRQPLQTMRAYWLGLWDVVTRRPSLYGEAGAEADA